jgi:hypothetical protein
MNYTSHLVAMLLFFFTASCAMAQDFQSIIFSAEKPGKLIMMEVNDYALRGRLKLKGKRRCSKHFFDTDQNLIRSKLPVFCGEASFHHYEYDDAGLLISYTDFRKYRNEKDSVKRYGSSYSYEAGKLAKAQSLEFYEDSTVLGNFYTYTYNTHGQLTSECFHYSPRGNAVYMEQNSTNEDPNSYLYHPALFKKDLTLRDDSIEVWEYRENEELKSTERIQKNAEGKVLSMTVTDTEGNVDQTTLFTYNGDGLLLEVIKNGNGQDKYGRYSDGLYSGRYVYLYDENGYLVREKFFAKEKLLQSSEIKYICSE